MIIELVTHKNRIELKLDVKSYHIKTYDVTIECQEGLVYVSCISIVVIL